MKSTLVFCIVSILSFVNAGGYNDTVEYYENLIPQEIARAFTFPLPTDSSQHKPVSKIPTVYGIFDYIIVGAGSAGSVVASRLSEVKENNVLLLEAGGDESDFSDIPAMNLYLQGLEFNWNYNSTPQTTSCLGMFNKQCPYSRGKGLGGSSILNALGYIRGNKRDYDSWEALGNPGWSYKDVLPFFMKSENSNGKGEKGYHGQNGSLNVEFRNSDHPQLKAFIDANIELGRKLVDFNGKQQLGVSQFQSNILHGRRNSAAKAFLKPAKDRSNLKILTHSFVTKILITKVTKKAYGVMFSHNNHLYKAKVRKEVIVSAGSINSPHLLMLSGIGPKEHLEEHKIPVIASLPVGHNFQDHAAYYALIFETNYTLPNRPLCKYIKQYLKGDGPFTYGGNSQGVAFVQTRLETVPDYPDIEFILVPSNDTSRFVQRSAHYNDEAINTIWDKVDPTKTFTIIILQLHPKSRGSVRLNSKDPYEYPLIDSQILSDSNDVDIETMYEGIQLALELLNTDAFKKVNATLLYAPLPACKNCKYLSRDYWYCQLRQLTFNLYHAVGTCAMGPDPSKGAVVNHELKVHGIKNLRVADASIMPTETSGHTHAPSVMIGEKAAHMIINEN